MPITDHPIIKNDELVEYRLTKLEGQYTETKSDIKTIMEVLYRLDKKLSNVPEGGLACNLHVLRMDAFRKELDDHKIILDGLQQFKWRAVGVLSVIMLLVQLLGATLFDKVFKGNSSAPTPVKIEITIPGLTNVVPKI
jgi:hypothetical protein